jgi:hypothetical protein
VVTSTQDNFYGHSVDCNTVLIGVMWLWIMVSSLGEDLAYKKIPCNHVVPPHTRFSVARGKEDVCDFLGDSWFNAIGYDDVSCLEVLRSL